jgi:head-tail adaptor
MAASKAYSIGCSGIPAVNAGMLRHQVNFQSQAVASPPIYSASGPTASWTTVFSDLAAIETISGKDMIKSGLTTTQLYLSITMYWRADVLPGMRVVRAATGSVYIVQAAENILEMDTVLVLTCIGLALNT